MLKIITTTIAAMSVLTLGVSASAQVNSEDQPVGLPAVAGQASGGYGASTLWAFIQADGTHSGPAGAGLATSAKTGSLGSYEVIFRRDIADNCVYVGAIAQQSFGVSGGFIDVVQRNSEPKGLFVQTKDLTGAAADRPFSVYVSCMQ